MTYYQSHSVDSFKMVSYAIDLLPLIKDKKLTVLQYALSFIDDLKIEIVSVLN